MMYLLCAYATVWLVVGDEMQYLIGVCTCLWLATTSTCAHTFCNRLANPTVRHVAVPHTRSYQCCCLCKCMHMMLVCVYHCGVCCDGVMGVDGIVILCSSTTTAVTHHTSHTSTLCAECCTNACVCGYVQLHCL